MISKEEHIKLLHEVDERVLPRREWETDEQYAKRMRHFLNSHDIHAEKHK